MKKTNIALAIFSAIALAACGGSSNDDAVDNSSNTGTVQPGINNGNVGTVQPGNNGNTNTNIDDTNTNTGDTNTNTGDTNTNTGNNNAGNTNAGNNNAGNTNAGNTNAGNTNTGTTTPTKPTKPTDPKKPEQPKPPTTGDVTGAEKIGLSKNDDKYAGFDSKKMQAVQLSDDSEYKGATIGGAITRTKSYDEKAFVKNPKLLGENNELPETFKRAETNSDDDFEKVGNSGDVWASTQIAYFDGKEYKSALAVKGSNKLYKQKSDNTVGEALTSNEIYQISESASNNTINGINIFGQPLKITSNEVTDAIKVSQLNRSLIPQHEVVTNEVLYNVRLNSPQLKLNNDSDNSVFSEDQNAANLTPNLNANIDVVVGETKAYNLPFVLTTYMVNDDKIVPAIFAGGKTYLGEKYAQSGNSHVLLYGDKTIKLPKINADYQGKVFTPTSTGDLNMSVELDEDQIRFHKVDITGRNNALPDLKLDGAGDLKTRNEKFGYFVNLKRADSKPHNGSDVKALVGDFYGLSAENTAGVLISKQVKQNDDVIKGKDDSDLDSSNYIGAFAAEKK